MKKLLVLPLLVLFIGFTSCSDNEDDSTDDGSGTEAMAEEGTILSYENVELKLVDSDSDDYGIAFSVTTGETYKSEDITTDNIAEIDLVSFSNQAFISFFSPNEADETENIEGVKTTIIQSADVAMTSEEFDTIEDDTLLKDLVVADNNGDALSISYRGVILFETAEGKIGALRINAINAERISFDVKVIE